MQNLTEKIRSFRKGKQNQQPNPASKKPLPTNNLVSPKAKLPRKAIRKDLCNLRTKTYFCSPRQNPVNRPESKHGRKSCPYGCSSHDPVTASCLTSCISRSCQIKKIPLILRAAIRCLLVNPKHFCILAHSNQLSCFKLWSLSPAVGRNILILSIVFSCNQEKEWQHVTIKLLWIWQRV